MRIRASSDQLVAAAVERANDVETRIRASGGQLVAAVAEHATDAAEKIDAAGSKAVNELRGQGISVRRTRRLCGGGCGNADRADAGYREPYGASSAQAIEAMRAHGEAVATRLDQSSRSVAQGFEERAQALTQRIEAKPQLAARSVGAAERVSSARQHLDERLEANHATLVKSVNLAERASKSAPAPSLNVWRAAMRRH